MTTRRKRRAPAPPEPEVNIGPCAVADCAVPASVEIIWPAAHSQKFCGAHAEDARAGRPKAK